MFHCPLLLRVPPYTTLGEMVCSSWSQSGYLDFQTLSCLNVATVFHRSWLISAGRYLIGSSAPRVPLSHTAQQSEAPELETSAENKKRERERDWERKCCSSIFKQHWDLSQHASVFHPCNVPHNQKKKVMGNQADSCFSGELELILELHYSGREQVGEAGGMAWGTLCLRERVEKHSPGARSACKHTSESLQSGRNERTALWFSSDVSLQLLSPQMDVIL